MAAAKRSRTRAAYFRAYNAKKGRRASAPELSGDRLILGIDGEGYTLPSGKHRYVYMAASSPAGLVSDVRNPKGLSASQVFRWLLSLPKKALLVGFALGYDRTKWVESWPDERVWRLMRPEERLGETGPLPVTFQGWRVNLVSTRMTVGRDEESRTVWDVWKFFQSSFVKALDRWTIGDAVERRWIEKQKARRGNFKRIGPKEERYCQLECTLLAELVGTLLKAHDEAGVKLRSYYGPGSSAAVVLEEMAADEQNAQVPERMAHAVACAYFGGRFECSRVGPVKPRRGGKLYAYDIASAYPWAFTRIPCLDRHHGTWVRRKSGSLKGVHPIATCVRFEVRPHKKAHPAWGPLPHRTPDGDILFPLESAGGWAWLPEFQAGKKLHPGVRALECWTWRLTCDCEPPFNARVRELFALRKEWGKSARGLVLKLLLNSLYGKSAQRLGKGRFRCMVRAGLVTAMTRGRLLSAVSGAGSAWDVLELATDSVLSLTPLPALQAKTKGQSIALGDWEAKSWPGGAFLMRPGMRFALRSDGELDQTAARGIGVKTLHKNRLRVKRAWDRAPMKSIKLSTPSFFHGAKLAIRSNRAKDEWTRDGLYGCWTSERRTINYKPTPKRCAVEPDYKLTPWRLPRGKGCESAPYDSKVKSKTGDELERMRELEEEQPDREGVALV